jgi:hypothetical protein
MKTSILKSIPTLLLLCFGLLANGQTTIKGLALTKEATAYFQSAGYSFLKVGDDGKTYPADGYKMYYNSKDASVLISKHHNNTPGKKMVLLRGGADFFCTGCEEESCEIEKAKRGVGSSRNEVRYDCIGCYKENGGVELCEGSLILRKVTYRDIYK